jgi:hypothetical protein
MKAFVSHSGNVPLYPVPNTNISKLCDLPPGAVIHTMTDTESIPGWMEILYKTNHREWRGYTYSEYVEEWIEPFDHDLIRIRNATPNQSDFAQNLIYLDNVQHNLCGQFCVLYCAGWDEMDVEDWLDTWQLKQPSAFRRILDRGRSLPTGIPDLVNMLQTFEGYPSTFALVSDLFRYHSSSLFTPRRLLTALQSHRLIVGCKIEAQFGRLSAGGIPHWIVLESILPEARGGLVRLYNPASNSVETYTWEQVVTSVTRSPLGIAVPR